MSISGRQLQRNQLIDLTVTGLAFGGKGIARLGDQPGDFVVFVTGAVPGDVVRARVIKNKKRYAEAQAEQLLTPSPDRLAARCPSFGTCGGCAWQTLDYGVQLEYKTGQVRESLEHLGGLRDFELRPIVGMADPWRYRNRADFSIGMSENGAVIGFRPPGRWDTVLSFSECHLLNRSIESVRGTVEAWLRENGLPGWDPRTGTGYARHLLVRSAQGGKEVVLSLVTAPGGPSGVGPQAGGPGDLPDAAGFVQRVRAAHPEVVGIAHAVNGGKAEISSGLDFAALWGRPYLLERVAGVLVNVSIDAFFQTNTLMAHALYGLVAREAGLADGPAGSTAPVIWDLYSGVGSIGLSLAGRAEAVLGIETVPAAVRDARHNARLNAITNTQFVEGDVAKVLREVADGERKLPEGLERPDVIVVDPPRAGLAKKAVSRVGEVGAPRIVYVSCNPATLAPNAADFGVFGYRLQRVTPVDMFPHTPHVEAVALLSRESD
ncbi:MAG: 23S rRNA (uracil(1939)-C(5))-methyltransferase RlmD [Thermoleophilia bacterium]|nr:23S rRNA (uracil(1939)-C(5))-methyltransferase RlmD [Thermoleophilia bacterium]